MGGVFAVLPAYEADLYGAKYIGAIHGRLINTKSPLFLLRSKCVLSDS